MPSADCIDRSDVFGIIKPSIDAHTLGINYITRLLQECSQRVFVADDQISDAASYPSREYLSHLFYKWLQGKKINRLCFSYRLDPDDAVKIFNYLVYLIKKQRLFSFQGGSIKKVYFAGLPAACEIIEELFPELVFTFRDREDDATVLSRMGITHELVPANLSGKHPYDQKLHKFGKDVIKKGMYKEIKSLYSDVYPAYGTNNDSLALRLQNCYKTGNLPLLRSHAGPFFYSREDSLKEFYKWVVQLRDSGFIDILSIGISQLSQSHFGEDWGDMPNGGGVPVNSIEEYSEIYEVAKPMLVRTYAGTKNIKQLAQMYEEAINIAWHALSFWWFCKLDGRGGYELHENLQQHLDALEFITRTGKPFEPNIPHQFAFRGSDDITFILSAYIAAKVAKRLGIKHLVLQNMLNTPRQTWAIQDLAKARAMLSLIRTLEDNNFHVYLQTRAGLDLFSSNIDEAKAQLAAVTALMDDIEPGKHHSPHIIHVVSFTEGACLATPEKIIESAKLTLHALQKYRFYRKAGYTDSRPHEEEISERVKDLVSGVKLRIKSIENTIPDPYSPHGLYLIFAVGYLPTPLLWKQRAIYPNVVRWNTRFINGGVKLINDHGSELTSEELIYWAENNANNLKSQKPGGVHF